MTQITRLPIGLQEFLGTQAFGKNPSELAQTVVPVLQMGEFFGIGKQKNYNFEAAGITGDGVYVLDVPDSEYWVIESVGVGLLPQGLTQNDETTFNVAASQLTNSNNPSVFQGIVNPVKWVYERGTSRSYFASPLAQKFVCLPGSRLNFAFTQTKVSAGSINAQIYVRYLELKA